MKTHEQARYVNYIGTTRGLVVEAALSSDEEEKRCCLRVCGVRGVSLITSEGDQSTRIKTCMHSPELLAEVCKELGQTFRSNGYRTWELQTSKRPPRAT